MAFYEIKEEIIKKITAYLQSVQREKGLITDELSRQYREMTAGYTDYYSRSFLLAHIPKEEYSTFSTMPPLVSEWQVSKNLEEVFTALGFSTTIATAHSFEIKLRRRSIENVLTDEQKNKLQELKFFSEQSERVANWLVRAREILTIVNSNVPLMQSVTEEEKQFAKELNFDWSYDYSDDGSVWRAGCAAHKRVNDRVKEVLEEKPHLIKVVEAVATYAGYPVKFFTGK